MDRCFTVYLRAFLSYAKLGYSVETYGAIEAGGTKFICGIGRGPADLRTVSIPTTSPAETIARTIEFFRSAKEDLSALGLGSFGPVELDRSSPQWGHITTTPKSGWQGTDLAGPLSLALKIPVAFDTDVNAAALAESRWGAALGLGSCAYMTVGTGIGGGALVDGRPVHGMLHPEMGHMRIPHDRIADPFAGNCPFHGDCLEGLAAGPALQARWGFPAQELPADHPAWPLQARYLAFAVANLIFTLSPHRVILGGGVMHQTHLLPLIRNELRSILAGYVQTPAMTDLDEYVVAPALGDHAGVLGALGLAIDLKR